MYLIAIQHLSHNNVYYFKYFDLKDDILIPRGTFRSRAFVDATQFRSIKDACAIVRCIDRTKYRPVIVPIGSLKLSLG